MNCRASPTRALGTDAYEGPTRILAEGGATTIRRGCCKRTDEDDFTTARGPLPVSASFDPSVGTAFHFPLRLRKYSTTMPPMKNSAKTTPMTMSAHTQSGIRSSSFRGGGGGGGGGGSGSGGGVMDAADNLLPSFAEDLAECMRLASGNMTEAEKARDGAEAARLVESFEAELKSWEDDVSHQLSETREKLEREAASAREKLRDVLKAGPADEEALQLAIAEVVLRFSWARTQP